MVSSLAGGSAAASTTTPARPAHHQRRHRADREGARAARIDAPARLERRERAVEPAGVGPAGPRQAALEHVLAVEMRALAVGRRRRMHDGRLAGLVQPVQVGHRRIEREEGVERQRRRLAVERERRSPRSSHPVGVADRRHRGEPVEAPRSTMARKRGSRPSARASFGRNGQANSTPEPSEQLAAGRGMEASRHGHLLWNSGAISSNVSACWRLSARATACACRARRAGRARLAIDGIRLDRSGDALGDAVGDVEPLRQAVDPGRLLVGKAFRRRRAPQRARRDRPAPPARRRGSGATPIARQADDQPLARTLELVRGVDPGLRRLDQRLGQLLEIAVGVEEALRSAARPAPAADRRRRNGARACARHARRSPDGAPGRRARRDPARRRRRRSLADHALRARLVHARIEHELAAVLRIAGGGNDGPAGDDLGEARDVVLGIDAAHAERMQLEDLARKVLVEAACAPIRPATEFGPIERALSR